jgi:hypothetical protein
MVQGAQDTMSEARGDGAALVRHDAFGAIEAVRGDELAVAVQSASAVAQVQARFFMAMQRPRNILEVRRRILDECKRPGFAKSAWYCVDNKGEGFSARFTDAAFRAMGNLTREVFVLREDDEKRVLRVQVTDLETNSAETRDLIVPKTVERRSGSGREVISKRKNKQGQDVFRVISTEDELFSKESNLASKVRRQCTLSMIPGDILEEAKQQIHETRSKGGEAIDPAAELKRIADAFSEQGVPPSEMEEYLGHPLQQLPKAGLQKLRDLFTAIRDGEFVWSELLSEKRAERSTAKAEREELQRKAEQRAAEAKDARAKADGEKPEPVVVDVAIAQSPAQPKTDRKMSVGQLLKDAQAAGLNAEQLRAQLKDLFGEADPKKVAESDRYLFVHGWLEPDPNFAEELAARRRELGTIGGAS